MKNTLGLLQLTAVTGLLAVPLCGHAAADELIGASLLTQQHPFYVELGEGMKAEAAKEGLPLEIAIANQDLNKQLADVEDFITKGASVIIIAPVDSQGVKGAVLRAESAGIKVITVDIPATGAKVTSHIGTDNYAGGVKAGELMAKILNDKGEVAVIDYPTVQSVVDRVNGFKKGLEAHPDVKIVAIQTGITRAEALAAAQNMLQANPEIDGIFGFGDDAALAAVSAVKSAGMADHVKVIGFDGMKEARDAVDSDPVLVAAIRQYPGQMGQVAIETASKIIKGEDVPAAQPIEPGVYMKGGAQ